ncbi:MAG: mercury(II) reductase [Sulfitobacter sp.]|uniref:Mercuric reductase n=2 Tax=Roseobacteraceae TaxID=2854170 RepID=A0A1H3CXP1_9RHOB|nr:MULTISPECIES: mercury(II) reductase [Sulfitobacter]MBQ08139.1 mercury(II) reductase [Roseobacter sp.]MCP3878050.1 mercury(II) reductase [Sulfitobacter sp.]SDX58993.1 mercuric reductase [Sulfitobacter pontiacus]HBM39301.1 mercury(II) reductase [Sulfitobacter sp.]
MDQTVKAHDCCTTKDAGSDSYDLIVVGAGSAGFSASITAAEAGKRVALVGHGTIGGTCVNVGCVPSKAMIRAADAVHSGRSAARFPGISPCEHAVDWSAVVKGSADLVEEMRHKKYIDLLPAYENLTYIEEGPARLVEGGVAVAERVISSPRILIATGSRPHMPAIKGIDAVEALDSWGLLSLPDRPDSIMVLGGGYIGCELAQMASRLGTKVTLVTRSRLLPGAEPEVAEALTQALKAEGIAVETGLAYVSVAKSAGGVTLTVERDGKTEVLSAERLVVTTGRIANSENLGLEELGIETDARGSIKVDSDMTTTRAGVWAAGDVTDRDQFVYMAAYGAKVAINNALGLEPMRYDNAAMPWVVFTDPQVAGVGLSEAEAKTAGYDVKTSVITLDNVPRAAAARDTRGVIKLVADVKTDRLLGGQIAAPEGSDTIQTLAMALKFGMTTKALGETIFPYLTTVEGLKLAAQTFDKDVAKLSCCAG